MITHIVFFRLPEDASITVAELAERLRSMDGVVPALRQLQVGIDIDRSQRAWDVALYTRFDDRQGLEVYRNDPFHQQVLAWLQSHKVISAVVDFAGD